MNDRIVGAYWKTDEREYNIQISYPKERRALVRNLFSDWTVIGSGQDPRSNRKILIFRKKIPKAGDFRAIVRNLNQNQTINLKEAT
jgi:hypothetical protein